MSQSSPASAMSQSTPPPAMSQSMTRHAHQRGPSHGTHDKHVAGTGPAKADAQLVLSGFSSDAGPDLHIYLANGSDENAVAAGKEIGNVAFDKPFPW